MPRKPSPQAKPRRRPPADRRAQVVQVARKLFARNGFEGVAMRAIAAGAGVSPAALYLYFPNKHALMAAVCDVLFAELIAMFAAQPAPARGKDPFARLRGFMLAYCAWGLAHPDEYRLLFLMKEFHAQGAPGHRGPPPPEGPQLGTALFAMLEGEVAALMQRGAMRRAETAMTAEAIWAAGHGLIALLTTLPAFPFTPPDRLAAYMAEVMLRGLAARPAPAL
jgi:AcrR family transcriptional regulator